METWWLGKRTTTILQNIVILFFSQKLYIFEYIIYIIYINISFLPDHFYHFYVKNTVASGWTVWNCCDFTVRRASSNGHIKTWTCGSYSWYRFMSFGILVYHTEVYLHNFVFLFIQIFSSNLRFYLLVTLFSSNTVPLADFPEYQQTFPTYENWSMSLAYHLLVGGLC